LTLAGRAFPPDRPSSNTTNAIHRHAFLATRPADAAPQLFASLLEHLLTIAQPGQGTSNKDQDELVKLIQRALPGASPDTWHDLARAARLRSVAVDDTIIRQGERIPLTMMVRGYGAFRRTTVNGHQLIVGTAAPGYMFGFGSVGSLVSSVEVVALTAGEAATWPGSAMRRLALHDPGFAIDVIDRLAGFLNVLTEKVDGFLHQDARLRVIRVLARHRDLFFGDPVILSRSHLPGLVGTSREMTGRVLRELEREGTVARVGRTGLRLLRPDQLDALVAESATDRA
jgi:CRP-like cAMP-binding protein